MMTPRDISNFWGSIPHKEALVECFITPEDKDWTSIDPESIEVEGGDFLWGLVRYLKPDIVVETGTYVGFASACIGLALAQNNRGHLWTIEHQHNLVEVANGAFHRLELSDRITVVEGDSMSDILLEQLPGKIDLLLVDGGNRPGEYDKYSKHLSEHGLALMHDALKIEGVYQPVVALGGKILWAGRGMGII
jgi:caffeoyl-CoA O-methyltransferase